MPCLTESGRWLAQAMRVFSVLIWWAVLGASPGPASGAQAPAEAAAETATTTAVAAAGPTSARALAPQLRIDPGTHTAMVRNATFDAATERVYTASDDKTVRVWQLPGGRLISTLRVPMLDGAEGQLYALALSPNGRWLAVGGWTGWDWEQRASVYVFDTQTLRLVRRLPVASWTITSLRFSPDGERIAVGMHGQGGLVVVKRTSGEVLHADAAYENKVMDMAFDRFGRLHTVGLDGFIRLYKQDFTLLARRAMRAAKDPVSLRVSPDGERLAVGFADAAVVEVVNARDLSTLGVLRATDAQQKDFVAVGWSDDARAVYASGDSGGARAGVHRWPVPANPAEALAGSTVARVIPATSGRITDLSSMSKGRLLYISDAPSVGWLGPDGRAHETMAPSQWNLSLPSSQLLVSPDASQISVSVGGRVMAFDVGTAQLDWQAPGKRSAGRPAVTRAAGWTVTKSADLRGLTVNGHAVALEEYERVRSHAIAPEQGALVVGTEWALRRYNAEGQLQWIARVSSPVWAVNLSADGRVVVVALGDGTLRWYATRTGQELLAVFPHKNATDWIAWVPGGYFASSAFGDRHIGWHINRGLDMEPDFVYAMQLERVLYRPDIVRNALGSATAKNERVPNAALPAVQQAAMTSDQMQRMAPPRLRVRLKGVDTKRAVARVEVQAEQAGPRMQDIALYVNDIPVTATRDRTLSGTDTERFRREYEVPLGLELNDIRVETFTGVSMGLARLQVTLPTPARVAPTGGDLYLLAVGASRFEQLPESAWLSYAAKDADAMASALSKQPASPFAKRHVKVLSDNAQTPPTRSNILAALEFLKSAKANDTVIVFLASHGVSDAQGNYFFVPSDAARKDLNGMKAVNDPKSLLSWEVFFDVMRVVAGKRILVVDTCQARGIEGQIDTYALIKRSASSQFAFMLASAANEESQEYAAAGHGLFTYGLLSTLEAAKTRSNDPLRLGEWFSETAALVQRYRDRSIGPQNPQFVAPPALQQAVVLRQAQAAR